MSEANIALTEKPKEPSLSEIVTEAMRFLGPLAAKYNHEHHLDTENNLLEVRKLFANRLPYFKRLTAGCKTLGDLSRKVDERYAGFVQEVTALEKESPSIERFERVCKTMRTAYMRSCGFQDASATLSPANMRAFALLNERPKTPPTDAPTIDDITFTRAEAERICVALKEAAKSYAMMYEEAHLSPLDGTNPTLAARFKNLLKLPPNERCFALLFRKYDETRFRYDPSVFIELQPILCLEGRFIQELGDAGADFPVDLILQLGTEDGVQNMLLTLMPTVKESLQRLAPDLMTIRGDKLLKEVAYIEQLPLLRSRWQEVNAIEEEILRDLEFIKSMCDRAPDGTNIFDDAVRKCEENLAHVAKVKTDILEGFQSIGVEPPVVKATTATAPVAEVIDVSAEPCYELGEWARDHVVHKVDFEKRRVTFKGNIVGKPGRTLTCPPRSDKPWDLLVRMLTTANPKGWIELLPAESKYVPHFLRSKRGKKKLGSGDRMLREFYCHIYSAKSAGERGPTMIRLERKAHDIQEINTKKVAKPTSI